MKHSISATDRLLLQREFRVRDPRNNVSDLTERAEQGVRATKILFWYDETEAEPGNRKPITCAFGHKHGKGFVVELEDGRTSLIGKDCARKHFGFDFDEIVNRFSTEEDRQKQIRKLLAVREAMPGVLAELSMLADSQAVTGFDKYWNAFRRHFGKLTQGLAKTLRTHNGKLVSTHFVYSERKTERAAIAAAREQAKGTGNTSLYDRLSERFSTQEERDAAERAWDKFLARQPKEYVPTELEMGSCEAWELTRASDRSTPAQRVQEALDVAQKLELDRPTDKWGKKEFAKFRKDIEAIYDAIEDARRLIKALSRFAHPANVERIVAWAQQTEKMDHSIGQEVRFESGALVGVIKLKLSDGIKWPSTPALDSMHSSYQSPEEFKLAA